MSAQDVSPSSFILLDARYETALAVWLVREISHTSLNHSSPSRQSGLQERGQALFSAEHDTVRCEITVLVIFTGLEAT